jgi:hypothetical protein
MPVDVLRVAERAAGNAIERLTSAHHARRRGKLGRSAQRTPPDDGRLWAAGDPPPRTGNALAVLIEGAAYFPALEQAIRDAQRSVLIAGWSDALPPREARRDRRRGRLRRRHRPDEPRR